MSLIIGGELAGWRGLAGRTKTGLRPFQILTTIIQATGSFRYPRGALYQQGKFGESRHLPHIIVAEHLQADLASLCDPLTP